MLQSIRKAGELRLELFYAHREPFTKQAAAGAVPVLGPAGPQPKFEALNHPRRPPAVASLNRMKALRS